MGYAFYLNHEGRECGYGVEATCDHPGCTAEIDRGLGYLCGTARTIHGDGPGCGKYFCSEHRRWSRKAKDGSWADLCETCKSNPDDTQYFEGEDDDE